MRTPRNYKCVDKHFKKSMFFFFLCFFFSFKNVVVKVEIITICCRVYNIYGCDVTTQNKVGNGDMLEQGCYILLEFNMC